MAQQSMDSMLRRFRRRYDVPAVGAALVDHEGTCIASANLGYIIVGAAIDRVSRISFEEALHRQLLEPLGVHSVGYGAPTEISGHRAKINLGDLGMLPVRDRAA